MRSDVRVLVTGGTGFVGGAVLRRGTSDSSITLRAALRRDAGVGFAGIEPVRVGDLGAETDWSTAVKGVDVVVHAAARVHIMREDASDPLEEFRRVNVAGTLSLAEQAARAGVRRCVYLSSVKVNGEETAPGRPFTVDDLPAPIDAYGVSKNEAEQGLRKIAAQTEMDVVIIRPVLVYGAGVKGNFRSMIGWLRTGLPLPFGSIHNKRSLLAVDNLVDLIMVCLRHRAAANQTFLASDGHDLSTTELMQRASTAMEKPSRLLPVPPRMLELAAGLTGTTNVSRRLLGNLQVDIRKTMDVLDWRPPLDVQTALHRAIATTPNA